jgi:hypothetical protein
MPKCSTRLFDKLPSPLALLSANEVAVVFSLPNARFMQRKD